MQTVDPAAFYTDELKSRGLDFRQHGSELKCRCPFPERHLSGQDSDPSFTVNIQSGVYFCNACGSKGNIHTFICETQHLDSVEGWYALGDALGYERPAEADTRPLIDPGLPGKWHRALMAYTGVVRDVLREKRGLTDETLVKYQIGWDGDRVTIPIYDENGELANIRRYKWNSNEDGLKMINFTDVMGNTYGENRIYGIENLTDEKCLAVVWCEGEWDRLVCEQNGIPACTGTAGANNLRIEWLRLLKTKRRVYICYDNDTAGSKATEQLVEQLRGSTEIYVVNWPEDFVKKGDITDWFVTEKRDRASFRQLFKPLAANAEELPVVALSRSSDAAYAGRRIKVPVLVAGKENAPFIYPKDVTVSCDSMDPDDKKCAACLLCYKKRQDIALTSKDALILKLIDCPDDKQLETLKRVAGASARCLKSEVNIKSYGNLECIQMIPKADVNFGFALRQEYVSRSGYVIGNNLPTNKKYMMVGYMHADPNNQRATYVFDTALPEKDLAEEFVLSPEVEEQLKLFQCAEGQTVTQKFNEIHQDLERNVTYIWDRRRVAVAVDLVYHSAISFMFQEQPVKRGWTECLIIGDSGQAKTTLVERLMSHYKAGELLSGESSRRTGLVYSLQQNGSKGNWTLIWGAMPLNDGGLVTVDELSGMAEDDLAKMSDVRSSGIAKATGVIAAETTARTRMIFISNPRNGRQLRAETYGVSAILKLWGKAEDVRRLDFAIAVASGEVDTRTVNRAVSEMPEVPHVYTSRACNLRVMWAWSRRPDDILFTTEATQRILDYAEKMGKKYSPRIPLVEPADQRLKLARLSVAAATCVCSTDETWQKVVVKPEHVDFVYEYLNSVYDQRAMGYDRFSQDEFESNDTTDGAMDRLRVEYISIPIASQPILGITKALYQLPYFNRNQLEDATGLDRDELKLLMQFLISSSVIERAGQDYKRTPMGLTFIESILMEPPTDSEIREARQRRFSANKSEI